MEILLLLFQMGGREESLVVLVEGEGEEEGGEVEEQRLSVQEEQIPDNLGGKE